MFKQCLLATACLLVATSSFAQQKWNLQRCVQYAIENNVGLKINKLSVDANQSTLAQSNAARLPNLNISGSQGWSTGRNIDPRTNQFVDRSVWSNNWSVNTGVTLFNGFSINNTIKQSQYNVQAAQFDYERTKNDLVLNVVNAYLQIMLNKELIETAKIQLQNTTEQLDRTLKLIEGGRLAEANKYDLISQQANDELRIVTAENNMNIAIVRLKQLLQVPMDEALDLEIPQIQEPNESGLAATSASIYETAETSQPIVKNADALIKSAEFGVEIAKANRYPIVTFGANISSVYSSLTQLPILSQATVTGVRNTGTFIGDVVPTDPNDSRWVRTPVVNVPTETPSMFNQWLDQNIRYGASINLQIPIYSRGQIKNGIKQATIQQERATLQAQNVRNQLRQTIEQAYVDAKGAAKTYQANKVRANALTESTRIAEQRFTLGAINAVEYTLSKNNLAIAQSDMVRTKYEYVFRLKVLDFYMGKEIKLD